MRPDAAETVGKVILGGLAAVFLVGMFALMPGADRLVSSMTPAIGAIVRAVVAITVALVLAYTAAGIATSVAFWLNSTPDEVEMAASVVYWLVVFFAVVLVHWGLAPSAVEILGNSVWMFDVIFFLAALGPVVVIATRLSLGVNRAAERLADRITGENRH